jgi:hypothetical protein
MPSRLDLRGRNNETIRSYFSKLGGPAAYLGTSIPNFPNFYMLLGPNTAGGHASVVFNEEVQINHALELIRPVIVQRTARSFEVREQVFTRYNEWIQRRLKTSVWEHCRSYYRADGGEGRNVAIFPGPVTLFWWIANWVKFSDYKAVGAERFERERMWKKIRFVFGMAVFVAAITLGSARNSALNFPAISRVVSRFQ